MKRTPALTFTALALTVAFGVAGCSTGGSDDTDAATSAPKSSQSATPESTSASKGDAVELTAAPATGDTITGTGYSYKVPAGWRLQDESIAPGTDTAAADLTGATDFANNVNVILSPAGALTPDQVEMLATKELEGSGATNVTVNDRVLVDGSPSAHISADMTSGGVTYRVHQYYATDDGQTYVITVSFGTSVPDSEAVPIAESILATWTLS